ncbi:MAG TPA: hypothetical protein VMH39_10110 [Gemmatimonadaceae bacterium]|nr:hypothetical protein [Gemmatimonadaceae bacterium]
MSASFVSGLRARSQTIVLAEGEETIAIRVEMPEVWDAVRVVVFPRERVLTVKEKALAALYPEADTPGDFVLKLAGWEILDESVSLADAGVVDDSILLLTFRRRRAVR